MLEIDEVVQSYLAGRTLASVAVELGVHQRTVAAHLEDLGIPRRLNRRKMTEDDVAQAPSRDRGGDGRWCGFVTMGTQPDGSSDRRKRGGSTLTEVTRKVRALERARDERDKLLTGRSPRLETWLEEWLTASALRVRPS